MTDAVRAAQLELELRAEARKGARTHARTHAHQRRRLSKPSRQAGTLPPLLSETTTADPCEIAGSPSGRCVRVALCGTYSPADRSACARSL